MEAFSVFDRAVGSYAPPFFVRARGEAIRSFMDECQNQQSNLYKHPLDFVLFCVGYFDIVTGVFRAQEPEKLVSAADFVRAPVLNGSGDPVDIHASR